MLYWSIARYDLRLSDKEFWEMIPRQLDALIQRMSRAEAVAEYPLAHIQALIYNIGARPTFAAKAEDFMRSTYGRPAEVSEATRQQRVTDKLALFIQATRAAQKARHGR